MDCSVQQARLDLQYLMGLTPSKKTKEIVEEIELKKLKVENWAINQLNATYDIDELSAGIPEASLVYTLLHKAATTVIPSTPEMVFSSYAQLVALVSNQASELNLLANVIYTELVKIETIRERAEAMWFDWSASTDKWRLEAEFRRSADDLISLVETTRAMHKHCVDTYKDRQRVLEDLRSIYYTFQ